MLLPELKSLFVMKTLVDKYSQPGALFYDPFACSYEIVRVFMSLPLHWRYIFGYKDDDFPNYAMIQVAEIFTRQLLNSKSDTTGTDYLEDVSSFLLLLVDAINSKPYSNDWSDGHFNFSLILHRTNVLGSIQRLSVQCQRATLQDILRKSSVAQALKNKQKILDCTDKTM